MMMPPTILGPIVAGDWIAVKHPGPHWRVWNSETGEYHRTDNALARKVVRVYDSADAAQNRANKLNRGAA